MEKAMLDISRTIRKRLALFRERMKIRDVIEVIKRQKKMGEKRSRKKR